MTLESKTSLYRKTMKKENQQKGRNGSSGEIEVPPKSFCGLGLRKRVSF